jgi:hypothetical protein
MVEVILKRHILKSFRKKQKTSPKRENRPKTKENRNQTNEKFSKKRKKFHKKLTNFPKKLVLGTSTGWRLQRWVATQKQYPIANQLDSYRPQLDLFIDANFMIFSLYLLSL